MDYNESEIRFWNKYYFIMLKLDESLYYLLLDKKSLVTNQFSKLFIESFRGSKLTGFKVEFYNPNSVMIIIQMFIEQENIGNLLLLPQQTKEYYLEIRLAKNKEKIRFESKIFKKYLSR